MERLSKFNHAATDFTSNKHWLEIKSPDTAMSQDVKKEIKDNVKLIRGRYNLQKLLN